MDLEEETRYRAEVRTTVWAGIYGIHCSVNDTWYVGQTNQRKKNMTQRWNEHLTKLFRDRPTNPHLQNSWRKYGPGAFTFHVLEETQRSISPEALTAREQWWKDSFPRVFNVGKNVDVPSRGNTFSAESKERSRQGAARRWSRPEEREHLSALCTARSMSVTARKQLGLKNRKWDIIVFPLGIVWSTGEAARHLGVDTAAIYKAVQNAWYVADLILLKIPHQSA